MAEEKLKKCKDKKEFIDLLNKYLTTALQDTFDRKVGMTHHALYEGILLFTSEFLNGIRDEKSYKKAVKWALKKYRDGSDVLEKRLEAGIEETVECIVKAYPVIKKLPGDYDFAEKLKKSSSKKEDYVV